MFTLTIWFVGILIEFLILVRGARGRLIGRFAFFYLYVTSVFLADLSLYFVYRVRFADYPVWSSRAELLNLVLGYSILLEIFRHVLSRYPGAERFARIAGLVIFVLVLCFALLHPNVDAGSTRVSRKILLERNFVAVQAVFFLGAIAIVYYYGLEVGRNIKGMIVGYGAWLGASVITLALRYYIGSSFDAVWLFVQPFSYLFSLVVWLCALWNYSPILIHTAKDPVEADYALFAARTRGAIGQVRAYLGRTARP